ncbi:PRAME family member 12-like [Fukomys damarensis]|uniref:PRAME family member 12-like n=1 Tax=Fukomys damarensis TaxID=885580 RepID=UPI0014552AD2|nr:PRAME family member 12-like [Fukomys damarensis]
MTIRNLQTSDTEVDIIQVQKRMLQAMLDGLDVLLSQKICSRRLKLQVLDMLDMHQKFCRVWAGHSLEVCSSEAMKRRNTGKSEARAAEKRPLRVTVDLSLGQTFQTPFQTYLLKWIQKRKDLVQLDCTKLCVTVPCIASIAEVLEMLNHGSVKELNVRNLWTPFTLVHFAPYLGHMKNLKKLILNNIRVPVSLSLTERKELVTQTTFEFLKLLSLEEMYMESVSFLEDHLDQVLRPEPLRSFLNNLTATLTTLHLQACGITDAQVHAFLPTLSNCSQLTTFSYMWNCMSVATLESLLCHTARLSSLSLMYSAPEEVCVSRHGVHQLRQDQILDGLRRIMLP